MPTDIDGKDNSPTRKITGGDEAYELDIIRIAGVNRAAVDANISSINVPLGKDPLPDSFFTILTSGQIGDTLRLQVAATNNDSTVPDSDIPAVDFTYTLVAGDVGNEQQLASNFVDAFNNDAQSGAAFLEANFVGSDDKRAIVHVTSTIFSLNDEFVERPNVGDFAVIPTGGVTVEFFSSDHEKLISRPKEVSLARDPNNPHRLGVQKVSGVLRLRASEVDQIVKEYLVNGALSDEMASTPDSFRISSNPAGGTDKLIESLKFIISDNNIKVQTGNFLGANSALSNGILIRFVKEGVPTYTEPLITNTLDLLGQWSSTASENKIINQSGGDYLEATFNLIESNLQFRLEAGKNDYIEVLTQDNLSARGSIKMLAGGFLE